MQIPLNSLIEIEDKLRSCQLKPLHLGYVEFSDDVIGDSGYRSFAVYAHFDGDNFKIKIQDGDGTDSVYTVLETNCNSTIDKEVIRQALVDSTHLRYNDEVKWPILMAVRNYDKRHLRKVGKAVARFIIHYIIARQFWSVDFSRIARGKNRAEYDELFHAVTKCPRLLSDALRPGIFSGRASCYGNITNIDMRNWVSESISHVKGRFEEEVAKQAAKLN